MVAKACNAAGAACCAMRPNCLAASGLWAFQRRCVFWAVVPNVITFRAGGGDNDAAPPVGKPLCVAAHPAGI